MSSPTKFPDGAGLDPSVHQPQQFDGSHASHRSGQCEAGLGRALNGKNVGALFLMEAPLVQALAIPRGRSARRRKQLWIRARFETSRWTIFIIGRVALDSSPGQGRAD